MIAALLVFVLVTGAVIGAYFGALRLGGVVSGRQLEKRLRDLSTPLPEDGEASIVNREPTSPLPALDKLVADRGASLSTLIEQSGVKTTASAVLLISIGVGVVFGLLGLLFTHQVIVAIVAGLFGLGVPTLFLMYKRSVRMKKFEEQFPESLDLLARALRAGHAFQTAMGMVAEELPDPVGTEFRKSFEQQKFGLPLKEALNSLAERVPHMDVRFFVTAVQIQRETGGNLAEILDNLANVVRERFKILRQVRVHTAHGRFTGYVLLALPAALAIALSFISPDHMKTLFEARMGRQMIMGAIVMQTIGFIWIRRVIKIEV
jgi:tight adherence protein B